MLPAMPANKVVSLTASPPPKTTGLGKPANEVKELAAQSVSSPSSASMLHDQSAVSVSLLVTTKKSASPAGEMTSCRTSPGNAEASDSSRQEEALPLDNRTQLLIVDNPGSTLPSKTLKYRREDAALVARPVGTAFGSENEIDEPADTHAPSGVASSPVRGHVTTSGESPVTVATRRDGGLPIVMM
jgi:hypothetical protein